MTDTQRPPAEEVDTTDVCANQILNMAQCSNPSGADWADAVMSARRFLNADRSALKQHGIGLYYDDEVAELRAKATALDQYLNWLDKKPAELPSDTCGEIAEELRTLITEHTTEEGK